METRTETVGEEKIKVHPVELITINKIDKKLVELLNASVDWGVLTTEEHENLRTKLKQWEIALRVSPEIRVTF